MLNIWTIFNNSICNIWTTQFPQWAELQSTKPQQWMHEPPVYTDRYTRYKNYKLWFIWSMKVIFISDNSILLHFIRQNELHNTAAYMSNTNPFREQLVIESRHHMHTHARTRTHTHIHTHTHTHTHECVSLTFGSQLNTFSLISQSFHVF